MWNYGSICMYIRYLWMRLFTELQVNHTNSYCYSNINGFLNIERLITFRTMEGRHIPLDDPSVCILIINSGVKHELSGSEYPLRRAQCEQAAKTLGAAYLCDVSRKALEGINQCLINKN